MSFFFKPAEQVDPEYTTLIDDFEDGDISEYSGSTSDYESKQTTPVKSGGHRLECVSGSLKVLTSTSGLNAYPSQGDEFGAYKRVEPGGFSDFASILFGVQDSNNYYEFQFTTSGNEVDLFKVVGGSSTNLLTLQNATLSQSTWYYMRVDWDTNNDITVKIQDDNLNDIVTGTATDSTYTSGGIGFRDQSGAVTDYMGII